MHNITVVSKPNTDNKLAKQLNIVTQDGQELTLDFDRAHVLAWEIQEELRKYTELQITKGGNSK